MYPENINNEKELLARISEGDEKSFEQLFIAYFRPLVFLGQRILDSREDGEDTVAQVFSKLWREREQLQKVQNIKAFLYATVKNACLMHMRAKKRTLKQSIGDNNWEDAANSAAELEVTRAEVVRLINEQIQVLPGKCREIFVLSYLHGLSTQEVATRLNISVSNVTSQRSRAVQLLRKKILHKDIWIIVALLLPFK